MNFIIAASSATHSATHDASTIGGHGTFHYILIMALMMTGIYLILSRSNMIKSIIGLNLFQVAVIMFYVSMGKVEPGTAPILMAEDVPHAEHDDHHDAHGSDSHDAPPAAHSPEPKKDADLGTHTLDHSKKVTVGPTTSKASKKYSAFSRSSRICNSTNVRPRERLSKKISKRSGRSTRTKSHRLVR